jgi:hypothetical protein
MWMLRHDGMSFPDWRSRSGRENHLLAAARMMRLRILNGKK